MDKKIKKLDYLLMFTMIYMLLPIIIFCISWLKPIYAIIIFIPLIIFLIKYYKKLFYLENDRNNKIDKKGMLIITFTLVLLGIWLYYSGVGGFSFQNSDYYKHNALIHDLINYSWPVKYNLSSGTGNLVYYIAYYLPAALFGKFFGFSSANIFLFVWTYIGIVIGIFWIFRVIKKISIIPAIFIIIFGGFDFFGYVLLNDSLPNLGSHIEWWATPLQLSSMTTLLFWTPHMFVPAIIMTPFLLHNTINTEKINPIIYLLMTYTFLWAPFVLVGLIPIFIYYFYKKFKIIDKKKLIPINVFIHCFILGVILILFILSNKSSTSSNGFLWDFVSFKLFFAKLITFYILEFGLSTIFILHNKCKNVNYVPLYISVLCLMIFPLLHIGEYNDFAMRATIPSIIIVFIYFCKTGVNIFKSNKKSFAIMIVLLMCFSVSSINEIVRSYKMPSGFSDSWTTLISDENKLKEQYISINNDKSLFNKYILK